MRKQLTSQPFMSSRELINFVREYNIKREDIQQITESHYYYHIWFWKEISL